MNVYKPSWDEIIKLCDKLAEQLQEGGYKQIIAVSRGGLIPACRIAHHLKIYQIHCLNIHTYEGQNWKSNPIFPSLTCLPVLYDQKKLIVIDDIVDSGKTLSCIREVLPHAYYVALYEKIMESHPKSKCDLSGKLCSIGTWVQFPWEIE
jgi:xanthine phosphoribosyltransferase